jgi:hypothetical protein
VGDGISVEPEIGGLLDLSVQANTVARDMQREGTIDSQLPASRCAPRTSSRPAGREVGTRTRDRGAPTRWETVRADVSGEWWMKATIRAIQGRLAWGGHWRESQGWD